MENIQVALRVRPFNKKESSKGEENAWQVAQNNIVIASNYHKDMLAAKKLKDSTKISYSFDHVFSPEVDNAQVYESVVKRIVLSSLNGINGTIFMYGQTGSGKTYSMMGYRQKETESATLSSSATTTTIMPLTSTLGLNSQSMTNPTNLSSPKSALKQHSKKLSYQFDENKIANENKISSENDDMIEIDKPNFLINNDSSTGILILALQDIFNAIENDLDKTYFLRCSYVEIYNDQIYDLLKNSEKLGETLTVNEDAKRDFYIKGAIEESVSSISEILEKLRKGEINRHYAATMMNHTSSRSHTIFRLTVQAVTNNFIRDCRRENLKRKCTNSNINNETDESSVKIGDGSNNGSSSGSGNSNSNSNGNNTNINNNNEASNINCFSEQKLNQEGTLVTESILNFVDLAGSEKVSNHHMMYDEVNCKESSISEGPFNGKDILTKTASIKERVKEGQHINKSLFFLTQVISLKSEGKSSQHIPYRNSPLTKILRSSLGGNSRTLVILCITSAGSQFEQTMSTLRFGMNAKKIENKVQANVITNNDDEALKILITDYEKKIQSLEKNRKEDQHKYNGLIKQIDDLQAQRLKLAERLHNMQKLQLNKFTENLTEDDFKNLFNQIEDKLIYFKKVGILFNSAKFKKFERISQNLSNERINKNISPRQTRKTLMTSINNSKSIDYASDDELDYYSSKKNDQDLAFDCQGKFALGCMKMTKKQNLLLAKKIEILEENYKNLIFKYLQKYDSLLEFRAKYQILSKKFKEYAIRYCDEIDQNEKHNKELEFYRDLKGIQLLNDEELLNLEKEYQEKIDQIKAEKVSRLYKAEINNLRQQLNIPLMDNDNMQDLNNTYQHKKDLINADIQKLCMKDNEIDSDYLDIEDFYNDKLSDVKNEEESIWNHYKGLIDPINEELQELMKSTTEYNANLMFSLRQESKVNLEIMQKSNNDLTPQKISRVDIANNQGDISNNKGSSSINHDNIKEYQTKSASKKQQISYETSDRANLLSQHKSEPTEPKNHNNNHYESGSRANSAKKITQKQASPLITKKKTLGDHSDQSNKYQNEKMNGDPIQNFNIMDFGESFTSPFKEPKQKSLLNKAFLPQNSSGLPKAKKSNQNKEGNDMNSVNATSAAATTTTTTNNSTKPLSTANLNTSNNNSMSLQKNMKSSSVSRSKTPAKTTQHVAKNNKMTSPLKLLNGQISKKNNIALSKILAETTEIENISSDSQINSLKTGDMTNNCATQRTIYDMKPDDIYEIKANKENDFDESIDRENTNSACSSSLYIGKPYEKNTALDIMSLKGISCSAPRISSNNSERSVLLDDVTDFYQQGQANDQDTKKRRSRAERVAKGGL